MSVTDQVRRYWDDDSEVYDRVPNHHPTDPAEQAAWSAALADALPPSPADVLDCGAGTGFLSLMAARLGHRVTAVDVSTRMLERLQDKAAGEGLEVRVVAGPAEEPPPGPFGAVMERHLLWTLPDPLQALRAWRTVAPGGRLVLVEGLWGRVDPAERLRARARELLSAARGHHGGGHHAPYPVELRTAMPFGEGTTPSQLVELATSAGWRAPRLARLRDVEWAATVRLPVPERLLGTSPRFLLTADAGRAS
ncbi:MAG: class I SAM-dependent methyltransferase [Acidimicrobiales bacterium]|nr:class I SAM-dependent methyltransferase [Acidimicrobiales bacterium]MBO0886428.1 class I SAM-dependent methyltransferase [Acidimicrobiales bacterium]MBO0893338.1 class I SAM-dependent methyltransferase [Acidimicrobiales bacterium]